MSGSDFQLHISQIWLTYFSLFMTDKIIIKISTGFSQYFLKSTYTAKNVILKRNKQSKEFKKNAKQKKDVQGLHSNTAGYADVSFYAPNMG